MKLENVFTHAVYGKNRYLDMNAGEDDDFVINCCIEIFCIPDNVDEEDYDEEADDINDDLRENRNDFRRNRHNRRFRNYRRDRSQESPAENQEPVQPEKKSWWKKLIG